MKATFTTLALALLLIGGDICLAASEDQQDPGKKSVTSTEKSADAAPAKKVPNSIEELGHVLTRIFGHIRRNLKVGMSTKDVEFLVVEQLQVHKVTGYLRGHEGYLHVITASVNYELLYARPSTKVVLRRGDLLTVQLGVESQGIYADQIWTFCIGKAFKTDRSLLKATRAALKTAVALVRPGTETVELSRALETTMKKARLTPSQHVVGSATGWEVLIDPKIPCVVTSASEELKPGQILSLQAGAHAGSESVRVAGDGRTIVSRDGRRSAVFSSLLLVTDDGCKILTGDYRPEIP